MAVTVACLFAATRWMMNGHYRRLAEEQRQDVAREVSVRREHKEQQALQAQKIRDERVSGGMRLVSDGVLEQIQSGLLWTQRDNGAEILWDSAHEYCRGLPLGGGGWRLPTAAEMLSLYEPTADATSMCGSSACKVSALFELSRPLVWTSEAAGPKAAWYVSLEYGAQFADSVGLPSYSGALCVRNQ
jgi:hypothetical protein